MAALDRKLKFAVAVHGTAYGSGIAVSALAFCRAACTKGHRIERVFFYHDAVYTANALAVCPQDETDLRAGWQSLHRDQGVELAVCIAAALKRGVINTEEQHRYDAEAANLAPGFTIVGLGQFIDAFLDADRFVTFA